MTPLPNLHSALRFAAALLALAGTVDASADTPLKLPESYKDVEKVMQRPDEGPCTTCGVVVSVRSGTPGAATGPARPNVAKNPTVLGGPGGPLVAVPILGAGGASKEYRKPQAPTSVYIVTVRYDNGAYAAIEQEAEPQVRKGDRVRVNQGRVEPDMR